MNKGLFIITGANGGMGKAITRAIAGMGVPVVMACRNVERAAGVRDEIVREKRSGGVASVGFGVGCFHPFFC